MSVPQLRIATYLCPSVPVELVQLLLELLEERTGHHTTLQYEWRADGPMDNRTDPFSCDLVDLAFLPSSGYVRLESKRNEFAELLPVTPVFKHAKKAEQPAGTYIDIIVHVDKLQHNVSEVGDLRGSRWAVSGTSPLARCVTAGVLKQLGENCSFFGSTCTTASHLEAVNLVLSKKVEAAAIDAAALTCNRALLHDGARAVATLATYGPFSPYAVVANSRLDARLKQQIVQAFREADHHPQLVKFGLVHFAENTPAAYDADRKFADNVGFQLGNVPYY